MPSFAPADLDSLWFDVASDTPILIVLPAPPPNCLPFGPSMRFAVPGPLADVLIRFGGPDVLVTPQNGMLFPAGNLEILSMADITHISAMSPGGPSRLCITIGHGE